MTALAFIPGDTIQWVAVLIDAAAKGLVVLLLAAGATLLLRRSSAVCDIFIWRDANPLFIVTYEP